MKKQKHPDSLYLKYDPFAGDESDVKFGSGLL